jgi:hypothetical protein
MGKPNIRFALKGLEMRALSGSKAQSRFLLGGPLRANWVGELSWATFSWPLRDMEWKHPSSFEPCEAKHIQCQLELPFQMGNTSQERVLGYGSSFKKGPIHTVSLIPETDTDNFDQEHTSRKSSKCRMKQ